MQWLMFLVVLGSLMLANEISRRSLWAAIACFAILPLGLLLFVWPNTVPGTHADTWFHYAKVYSVLIACLGFLLLRYVPRLQKNKFLLFFPALILAVNIFEAVMRDFELAGANGIVDNIMVVGGPWNYMNGVAGILNILTICGWAGIYITRDKTQDMIWPDMMWFWIIAYDLWNFAYVYNCVGASSFYAGGALLLSCTIPAFFMCKGAWLQHRAHTLAFWMMFIMVAPNFSTYSQWTVQPSYEPTALFLVSFLSLAANIAVAVYQVRVIYKRRLNPLTDELYSDHAKYQEVADPMLSKPAVTA
ncbi:DUF5692 family protein [Ferrimonas pelagia]|uniref:DUF5692 family protein n=2 Tax=Ferrimonas pelagia TaxID=1177826 RepID=A0ABP9EZN0_9GAMM